jgi:hypothetical protein
MKITDIRFSSWHELPSVISPQIFLKHPKKKSVLSCNVVNRFPNVFIGKLTGILGERVFDKG